MIGLKLLLGALGKASGIIRGCNNPLFLISTLKDPLQMVLNLLRCIRNITKLDK